MAVTFRTWGVATDPELEIAPISGIALEQEVDWAPVGIDPTEEDPRRANWATSLASTDQFAPTVGDQHPCQDARVRDPVVVTDPAPGIVPAEAIDRASQIVPVLGIAPASRIGPGLAIAPTSEIGRVGPTTGSSTDVPRGPTSTTAPTSISTIAGIVPWLAQTEPHGLVRRQTDSATGAVGATESVVTGVTITGTTTGSTVPGGIATIFRLAAGITITASTDVPGATGGECPPMPR